MNATDIPHQVGGFVALWRAVIVEQMNLALSATGYRTDLEVSAAQSWFGTRDFCDVCQLAMLEPAAVMAAFRKQTSEGSELRALYKQRGMRVSGRRV